MSPFPLPDVAGFSSGMAIFCTEMGVSRNRGSPIAAWVDFMDKIQTKLDDGQGYPHCRKPPYDLMIHNLCELLGEFFQIPLLFLIPTLTTGKTPETLLESTKNYLFSLQSRQLP